MVCYFALDSTTVLVCFFIEVMSLQGVQDPFCILRLNLFYRIDCLRVFVYIFRFFLRYLCFVFILINVLLLLTLLLLLLMLLPFCFVCLWTCIYYVTLRRHDVAPKYCNTNTQSLPLSSFGQRASAMAKPSSIKGTLERKRAKEREERDCLKETCRGRKERKYFWVKERKREGLKGRVWVW